MPVLRIIDTETTILEGGVCEIASVDIVDGQICNPMSDFVKPPEPITVGAMAIHHITNEDVAGAPPIEAVIDRYLGADVYVAHNAKFDRSKLPQIAARPSLLHAMRFGKYKGVLFEEWVLKDFRYRQWCFENLTDDEDVQFTLKHHLQQAGG